ncbi:MAG TPA: NAD(P)/FAD-dependent oxidoreductase, partial [Ilumatobacteraceae bacterium]|nr:NAD(P)/FAD-dependent oxidoreductase [Ilumatobacteraceae bacterium]
PIDRRRLDGVVEHLRGLQQSPAPSLPVDHQRRSEHVPESRRNDSKTIDRPVFADGTIVRARTAVIATGVRDELPPINGLAARWGKSAFNCPFCDGWEHRDLPVVVIAAGPGAEHLATMLRSWTPDVTLVDASDIAELKGPGNTLETIELCDGTSILATAAFVRAPMSPRSDIARQLGCVVDDGGYIVADQDCVTSQAGVWAAGDVRRPPPAPHQVVLAAADGSTAAISIHKALIERDQREI